MNSHKENFTTFFHWFAWAISITSSIFFIIFDVRDDIISLMKDQNLSDVLSFLVLITAIIGSIVSIFRMVPGGVLMLIGGTGMVALFALHGGMHNFGMMVAYGLPYIIPGIFFILIRNSEKKA